MAVRNVTVSVEEDVALWARLEAARRDTSVSRLLGNFLKERMTRESRCDQAMQSALARPPFQASDGRYLSREQVHDAAEAEVRGLFAWDPVVVDAPVIEAAWRLRKRFDLSFWDALIVGAAKAAGCSYLLTEDLSQGQDLDGVRVVSPFRVAPSDLDRPR
jgi:predicted nucleic acid-binding protein